MAEGRYWDEVRQAYVPLGRFSGLSMAIREVAPDVWAKRHPEERAAPGPTPADDAWSEEGPFGG